MKGIIIAKCKYQAIGAEKAPSWKKICFQLGKLFFPTGNLKLGGYRKNLLFHPDFTIVRQDRHQPYMVKSFDKKDVPNDTSYNWEIILRTTLSRKINSR